MFKWHVHSAIGRSRPAAHDLSRVADGIAASLRQFSISLSRSAEENGMPLNTSHKTHGYSIIIEGVLISLQKALEQPALKEQQMQ